MRSRLDGQPVKIPVGTAKCALPECGQLMLTLLFGCGGQVLLSRLLQLLGECAMENMGMSKGETFQADEGAQV